jgi:hypothetical protein
MSLFGVQPDAAERYRATVAQGSILVIVDRDDVIDDGMLVSAARILNDAGCLPLAMSAE